MKLPSYTTTPGLDRFPPDERFALYRATHKRLIKNDAAYRKQWNSYVAGIVCVAIAPAGAFVGGGPYGIALTVFLPFVVVALGIFLSFRQQRFMNNRIGQALREPAT